MVSLGGAWHSEDEDEDSSKFEEVLLTNSNYRRNCWAWGRVTSFPPPSDTDSAAQAARRHFGPNFEPGRQGLLWPISAFLTWALLGLAPAASCPGMNSSFSDEWFVTTHGRTDMLI